MLVTLFVALGFWQLDRARDKIEIRDREQARLQLPPVEIDADMLDVERMAYQNANASGRYSPGLQILLDNQVHQGRAGFHVLTPLVLADGNTLLLVNRGWIPWGPDRTRMPPIETPDGQVDLSGRLAHPTRYAISFEHDEQGFQPLWQNLDLERYAKLSGHPVQGLVLLLSPENTDGGGFVRQWTRERDTWIQRHRGYAVQWFGLAIVLACIFVYFSIDRRGRDDSEPR